MDAVVERALGDIRVVAQRLRVESRKGFISTATTDYIHQMMERLRAQRHRLARLEPEDRHALLEAVDCELRPAIQEWRDMSDRQERQELEKQRRRRERAELRAALAEGERAMRGEDEESDYPDPFPA